MTISELTNDLKLSLESQSPLDKEFGGKLAGEMRIALKALHRDLKKDVVPVIRDLVAKHFATVGGLEYDDAKWAKKQFEDALWTALDQCYEEYNVGDT